MAWSRTFTPPMSDSLTFVSTCILVRSVAIKNRIGVWKLAATVWPISMLRETTTPLTGEMIRVKPRLTCEAFTSACRSWMADSSYVICADAWS